VRSFLDRIQPDDQASVIDNAELLAFIENHRWTAGLLKFLPEDHVTAVRQTAFGLNLGAALKRRRASMSAMSARNLAHVSLSGAMGES
jgi:hypothetical protein